MEARQHLVSAFHPKLSLAAGLLSTPGGVLIEDQPWRRTDEKAPRSLARPSCLALWRGLPIPVVNHLQHSSVADVHQQQIVTIADPALPTTGRANVIGAVVVDVVPRTI